MEQRVSLITLGVADLLRSRAFYEALGWRTGAQPADDVVFFAANGMVLGLWSRESLAEDSGVSDSGGFSGITLAYNARSTEEVDQRDSRSRGRWCKGFQTWHRDLLGRLFGSLP